jgi:hypothetical protein
VVGCGGAVSVVATDAVVSVVSVVVVVVVVVVAAAAAVDVVRSGASGTAPSVGRAADVVVCEQPVATISAHIATARATARRAPAVFTIR